MNETCRSFVNLLTAQEARYIEALETLDEVITADLHDLISEEISNHIAHMMAIRRRNP